MKKKLTTLIAATVLFISAAFANNTIEPTLHVQTEFNRVFAKSTNVKWETVSNFYIATFQDGNEYLTAYFNPDGAIESVSRNLSVSALPLILQKGLQDKLAGAWISENVELAGKNGTEYYITLENAETKVVYQSNGDDWTRYKQIKK